MRADPGERGSDFEAAGESEEALAELRVVPPGIEIMGEPARSFDAENAVHLEAGCRDLRSELVGMMEERVHEVLEPAGRVPVLAVREIALDDGGEGRVAEVALLDPVESRGET